MLVGFVQQRIDHHCLWACQVIGGMSIGNDDYSSICYQHTRLSIEAHLLEFCCAFCELRLTYEAIPGQVGRDWCGHCAGVASSFLFFIPFGKNEKQKIKMCLQAGEGYLLFSWLDAVWICFFLPLVWITFSSHKIFLVLEFFSSVFLWFAVSSEEIFLRS